MTSINKVGFSSFARIIYGSDSNGNLPDVMEKFKEKNLEALEKDDKYASISMQSMKRDEYSITVNCYDKDNEYFEKILDPLINKYFK